MATTRPVSSRRRVRVIAPSSLPDAERMAAGIERLREAGFEVDDPNDIVRGGHPYLNGTDDERRRELLSALEDSDVDIVWLARGGYGLTRFIHRVRFPSRSPVIVGFSDATALLAPAFNAGLGVVHGPFITTLADESEESFEHLCKMLSGKARGLSMESLSPIAGPRVEVVGPLFAANLCVLTHLIGTRSLPSLDGTIVVLEEVNEKPYQIDRMLTQLIESGALDGAAAVVVGRLSKCEDAPTPRGARRNKVPVALEVFRERLEPLGVPVIADAQVGHDGPNFSVPVGRRGKIEFRGARARLEFLEELA